MVFFSKFASSVLTMLHRPMTPCLHWLLFLILSLLQAQFSVCHSKLNITFEQIIWEHMLHTVINIVATIVTNVTHTSLLLHSLPSGHWYVVDMPQVSPRVFIQGAFSCRAHRTSTSSIIHNRNEQISPVMKLWYENHGKVENIRIVSPDPTNPSVAAQLSNRL